MNLGMPSQNQLRALINQVWTGNPDDAHAIDVIADAYDEFGRPDIAALWRGELPGFRRRQRVPSLSKSEQAKLEANFAWWRENVVYKTGPNDEQLALAAISQLYRADATHSSETLRALPKVVWCNSPAEARDYADQLARAKSLGIRLWTGTAGYSTTNVASDVGNEFARLEVKYLPFHITDTVDRFAEQDSPTSQGVASLMSHGQFSSWMGRQACTIDILRLDYGRSRELSFRAAAALARCCSGWYAFPEVFIGVRHPFVVENGQLPRWAWIDDRNQPHQWPMGDG